MSEEQTRSPALRVILCAYTQSRTGKLLHIAIAAQEDHRLGEQKKHKNIHETTVFRPFVDKNPAEKEFLHNLAESESFRALYSYHDGTVARADKHIAFRKRQMTDHTLCLP